VWDVLQSLRVAVPLRQAEIHTVDIAALFTHTHHEIGGLDIAVD
jgi:hypothetical protein